VNFNLPEQTVANSGCSSNCGQINLQNPGSLDALVINGSTNFMLDANLSGVNNWGNQITNGNALGYIPPVIPPAVISPSISEPIAVRNSPLVLASYVPREGIAGGSLREVIDFHADQTQLFVSQRMFGGVSVSSPEQTEVMAAKSAKAQSKSLGGSKGSDVCTVDRDGNTKCEED
jgi:hypothetical protein